MKRSKFSLSHYRLLTCDMGELIPCGLFEVLPGDTVQQATSMFVRVSPLLAPVMHPVHVRIHHWYVPNRILWDGWEDFITGGPDGMNNVQPPAIYQPVVQGSLEDYMGLPPIATQIGYSALPIRAYQMIWREWYRDQDLQAEPVISTADGPDTTTSRVLQNVSWEKDYFTSARPWTQKGPGVSVPIGMSAPVIPGAPGNNTPTFNVGATGLGQRLNSNATDSNVSWDAINGVGAAASWNTTGLVADLQSASVININQLREAFAIQRYEEARARYGSRYTEYLRYLGVRSSDARLQRPEYLGGGRQIIQFSEVLQTGPDTADEGVADLKGHGIGAMRSNRYRRFFEEHGWVLSLMSVKPKTMYADGRHRHWARSTKEDYWQRELQAIGQQQVLNGEVFIGSADTNAVFGYQDRYDEYRRMESGISGDFRSTLDHWHYARMFATEPALNSDFVKSVPTKRVNAEQTEDCLWIMANHSIQARRLLAGTGKSFIY